MKLVISAFPAVGKSTIFKEAGERGLKPSHVFFNDFTREYEIQVPSGDGIPVFDSDSSKFDKEFFPGNYIKHIKETLEKLDDVVILVSSHEDVRQMLRDQGIEYTLAYPERELKEEYIRRYKSRGNTEGFIGMMENAWNKFIDSCEEDPTPNKIVLGEGEFLGKDYLIPEMFSVSGTENMNDDPDWFHKSLKLAIEKSQQAETNPIDYEARLQRMKDRRDPLGVEEEKEVMIDLPTLHFPDGSTGSASDQVEIVRYNNEWQAYLAENPEADVSYVPIEIMGGESLGDIIHAPDGTTIDMAQPGWYGIYQAACKTVLEEKPDALITATIVDVNAGPEVTDQQTVPTDNPEATLLNTPEGTAQSTLSAEPPAGGVAAVDAATVAEPGPEPTTTADARDPMVDPDFVEAVEQDAPSRTELIEAKLEIENDIDAIDGVVLAYAEPEAAGLEQFQDGSDVLVAAVADIKERYGEEVEPTVAGLESFLDSLKLGFEKIKEKIKGNPTKADTAKVKKHLSEANSAFNEYASEKWQSEQKFINVGKTKIQTPELLNGINSPSDLKTILDLVNKRASDTYDRYHKNAGNRLQNGLKVFNGFKSKPADTPISEVDSSLPISPERLSGAVKDSGLDDLKVSLSGIELPVLNKDGIKLVCEAMKSILDTKAYFVNLEEKFYGSCVSEDDFYGSKFWDKHIRSKQAGQVWDAVVFDAFYDEPEYLSSVYSTKMMAIARFLEMWILKSVK